VVADISRAGRIPNSGLVARICFIAFLAIQPGGAFRAGEPNEAPAIRFTDEGTVEVSGLSDGLLSALARLDSEGDMWRSLFPVFVGDTMPEESDFPSILGNYKVQAGIAIFRPRFPFSPGLDYFASFKPGRANGQIRNHSRGLGDLNLSFVPAASSPPPGTEVEAIYPSSSHLPANLLRLYIRFSAPMLTKNTSENIRMLDDQNNEIPLTFVEVKEGLWDPTQRRLTVFFHPGRIKRGVAPNTEMGLPLEPGRNYRFVVDETMLDRSGRPLGRSFSKSFTAVEADRESPDPNTWQLTPPGSARGPVNLLFPQPLDHALLGRFLFISGPGGIEIPGSIFIDEEEKRWSFTPVSPWRKGRHIVRVHPELEDLAGNSLHRLFDMKTTTDQPTSILEGTTVDLSFTID
jgi:hypothetical protein